MFGVPAMRKLAREILEWNDRRCFEHMVTYATTPPLLPKSFENSHGMRLWQSGVLNKLGAKYSISKWLEASELFKQSGEEIMKLCQAALRQDKEETSRRLLQIADMEEKAYTLLISNGMSREH
jgi:hypothetical protein